MPQDHATYAFLTIVVGLLFGVLGTEIWKTRPFRSAGRFDLGVGVTLLVYGAVAFWRGLDDFWLFYPIFFTYFLLGLYLFRQHYILLVASDRRERDVANAALLGVPGLGAMVGLVIGNGYVFVLFLPAVAVSLIGLVLLAYDAVLALTGDDVYLRDIVASVVMLPQVYLYGLMLIDGALPE